MSPKRLLLAATVVAALVFAAPAAAAPDRTAPDFTADVTSFDWTGKLGVGFAPLTQIDAKLPCGSPGHDCDTTLMHVLVPGSLSVVSASSDKQSVDVDLHLWASDSTGAKLEELASSTGGSAAEAVSIDSIGDEWFLVEANYATVVAGTYTGKATFAPAS